MEKNIVSFTIENKERTWFHKLLGIKKFKYITGLSISHFKVSNSIIQCVKERSDGYYEFTIANEVELIN